jgi:hypothetical protein
MNKVQKQYRAMELKEVAAAMGDISESGVLFLEKSALRKLRRSPTLFTAWIESMSTDRRTPNLGTLSNDEIQGEDV